jgi:hypothetical protein
MSIVLKGRHVLNRRALCFQLQLSSPYGTKSDKQMAREIIYGTVSR